MTVSREVVTAALALARAELEEYGLPTEIHLDLSIQKAQELARRMKADVNLVTAGAALMDVKLGQAFRESRLADHVDMSMDATRALLRQHEVPERDSSIIINCVAAHHGTVPFESTEAEIVANADCYRFLHPRGVVHFIGTLTKRGLPLESICEQAQAKLDEKWGILSLEECKTELEPFYKHFSEVFTAARNP